MPDGCTGDSLEGELDDLPLLFGWHGPYPRVVLGLRGSFLGGRVGRVLGHDEADEALRREHLTHVQHLTPSRHGTILSERAGCDDSGGWHHVAGNTSRPFGRSFPKVKSSFSIFSLRISRHLPHCVGCTASADAQLSPPRAPEPKTMSSTLGGQSQGELRRTRTVRPFACHWEPCSREYCSIQLVPPKMHTSTSMWHAVRTLLCTMGARR